MSDVFISHVEDDADVALEIALGLEEAGYSTWCYEVDNIPGLSYLVQTGQRIEQAKAVVVLISPHSIGSHQVTREVVRAHESGKYFIPVRRDISHVEFQNRQPEWREAIGAASSISVTKDDVEVVTKRIIDGLEALGIHPKAKAATDRIEQIRRILTELRESGIAEGLAEPSVSPRKSEAEAVGVEAPYAKTAEKPSRRRSLIKKWSIAAAAIAVITLVVIFVSGGLVKYTLSTTVSSGGGTITPANGTYRDGAEVTLTASPAHGYTFDYWSGDATGTSNPVIITMDSDKSVTASFVTVFKLTTSVSPADDGAISLNPDLDVYKAGTRVALTATAAQGCIFDHWSGDAAGTSNPVTITMDSDKSLTAYFEAGPEILFSDDFSDESSGWDILDQSGGQVAYVNGGLYVNDYADKQFTFSRFHDYFTDFILEVETWLVDGTNDNGHMILFRSSDVDDFYLFGVGADGYYSVWKEVDGSITGLLENTYSSYINQGVGAVNLIHIECIGSSLSLSVNGHLLWEGTDVTFTGGNIALGAYANAGTFTEVAFDNIVVTEPGALFSDDFSDESSGWLKAYYENWDAYYEDGEYHILVKTDYWAAWSYRTNAGRLADFVIEIDARLSSEPNEGWYGVIFRFQNDDNFCYFEIEDGCYHVGTRTEGEWTILQDWTESAFIKERHQTNHLKVVAIGPKIDVYANGHHLTTVTDHSFEEGYVGVIVDTDKAGADAAFDNIEVYAIN